MLILSRERDEIIKIGDSIEVTVVKIKGSRVQLGVNAPPDVSIHRKETYDAMVAADGIAVSLHARMCDDPTAFAD